MGRMRYIPSAPASPWKPGLGYDGEVRTPGDLAGCSPERQRLLAQSLQQLLATATEKVRAGAAQYERAVKEAEESLIHDRQWLADLMAMYVSTCSIIARSAAEALELELPQAASGIETRQGEDPEEGLRAKHESPTVEDRNAQNAQPSHPPSGNPHDPR